MNKLSEQIINVLKDYAKENQITVRDTSDLSDLEEWLILKLIECKFGKEFIKHTRYALKKEFKMETTYPKKITFEYDNKDIVLIGDGVKKYFDENIINPISEAVVKATTYNKNAKCPICDSDKIDDTHYYGNMDRGNIIFRKCVGCGHSWHEKPLKELK